MTFDQWVAVFALGLSGGSFVAFLAFAKMPTQATEVATQVAAKTADATFAAGIDISKPLESAAKLIDSLTKAGPSLAALAASVLFMITAAYIVKPQGADAAKPPAAEALKPPVK